MTEDSTVKPISPQGCQRLLAETQWLERNEQDRSLPIHIFRLSGIYGPGRSVLETIRQGTAQRIHKPDHAFSRIHVEDIVSILKASLTKPQPGEVYNVADNEPAATADVIAYGCEVLGIDIPPLIPFEEAALSQSLREFYAENKRVTNDKIKNSLEVSLLYPTYRQGINRC